MAANSPPGVQEQDHEALLVYLIRWGNGDVALPILNAGSGTVSNGHCFGHRAFAQGQELVFLAMRDPAGCREGFDSCIRCVHC